MKKVYFAGKFNLIKNKKLSLSERLKNDFRSLILGDSKKLTIANDNLIINDTIHYVGPFYCEQASNGNYTSTDCNVVLNAELESVRECDTFLAVFDENFSVGTIVELGWALDQNKDIIIYYKNETSSYDIKSEYWFAIADAIKRSKRVKVIPYNKIIDVINSIKKEVLCYEI